MLYDILHFALGVSFTSFVFFAFWWHGRKEALSTESLPVTTERINWKEEGF